MLKPKRYEKLQVATVETLDKERYSFKEIARRLFNILFLKDQLEEMMCEFIDRELYKELDFSIFHIELIQKVAGQRPESR